MPRGGSDTRTEIISVAMRLFVDNGYDKTSLREIADEIGVTKAALYYHFRTKEDIVRAAMDAYAGRVTATVDWLESHQDDPGRHEELVDRFMTLFTEDGSVALRFGQSNPTVMSREDFGERHVGQIKRMVALLAGPGAGPEHVIRATLSFGALVIGTMNPITELGGTVEERHAAARAVALELLAPLQSVPR